MIDPNPSPGTGGGGGDGTVIIDPAGNTVKIDPAGNVVNVGNFPATQPISGTVGVSNFPATQAVTGAFYPATQPVSGTVSVGNLPATQPVSGSVSVANFPATQPVSGTFWPATQPVSGTVGVSNFPATQTVSGTVVASVANWPATQPVSGTVGLSTSANTVKIDPTTPCLNGERDPSMIWDGGVARAVRIFFFSQDFNNATVVLIAAAAGLKTKVLSVNVQTHSFNTAGWLILQDGASANIGAVLFATALGSAARQDAAGWIYCQTPVNSALKLIGTGSYGVTGQVVYYQAP